MKASTYSVGAGWRPLTDALIKLVEDNGGTVHQVKEKFGGLRFYYTEPDTDDMNDVDMCFWEQFAKLVEAVEEMCWNICEYTGAPGTLYASKGWIKIVSPLYAEEHGMQPVPDAAEAP